MYPEGTGKSEFKDNLFQWVHCECDCGVHQVTNSKGICYLTRKSAIWWEHKLQVSPQADWIYDTQWLDCTQDDES